MQSYTFVINLLRAIPDLNVLDLCTISKYGVYMPTATALTDELDSKIHYPYLRTLRLDMPLVYLTSLGSFVAKHTATLHDLQLYSYVSMIGHVDHFRQICLNIQRHAGELRFLKLHIVWCRLNANGEADT
jgi:hypothetical protein